MEKVIQLELDFLAYAGGYKTNSGMARLIGMAELVNALGIKADDKKVAAAFSTAVADFPFSMSTRLFLKDFQNTYGRDRYTTEGEKAIINAVNANKDLFKNI